MIGDGPVDDLDAGALADLIREAARFTGLALERP
jgi:hypothetical protein